MAHAGGFKNADASNKDVHKQITIEHGTKLVDVPDYLQKKIGIFNAGLGSYLQNKIWYLFGLYDTTRFQKATKTLTLIVMPAKKWAHIERTYRQDADSLTVLITGETGFKDSSGSDTLQEGNGTRFADASSLFETPTTGGNNKSVMARSRNNNEIVTARREVGVDHVPVSHARITSNPFAVYSDIAARNGSYFKGVWQNADPRLLFPGMQTRILYMDGEDVKEIYGVLHGSENVSHHIGDISVQKFINQAILYVFTSKAMQVSGT